MQGKKVLTFADRAAMEEASKRLALKRELRAAGLRITPTDPRCYDTAALEALVAANRKAA